MNLLVPQRLFDAAQPEMIDRADHDTALLAEDLSNLRRINRYCGGISAIRTPLVKLFDQVPPLKTIEILDLATGSADHPVEILNLARKSHRTLRIVAVDKNPQILEVASHITRDYPEISLAKEDLLQLDFADKSFDIVLCSLALHHFSNEDAVKILHEMHRLSRVGLIVNDLNRSWIGAWTAWLYTHATTRNPLTLNDSYLSVLRAFTPEELREMAVNAGIREFEIMTKPFFRLILVGTV
ncbi:MAG TPA: methyltransferase domain-containing protein [Bacteroidota bacterium]|nr:methyltransferase domain-containing protein [Bacteroidota bacterium]